jgi:hypothetical protein
MKKIINPKKRGKKMKKITKSIYTLAIAILLTAGNTVMSQEMLNLMCKHKENNSTTVNRMLMSRDDRYIAVDFLCGSYTTVKLLDLITCQVTTEFPNEIIRCFTPDGKSILTGGTIAANPNFHFAQTTIEREYPQFNFIQEFPFGLSPSISFDMQYAVGGSSKGLYIYEHHNPNYIKLISELFPANDEYSTTSVKSVIFNPKNHLILASWAQEANAVVPPHIRDTYPIWGFLVYDMDNDSVIIQKKGNISNFAPIWCGSDRVVYRNDHYETIHPNPIPQLSREIKIIDLTDNNADVVIKSGAIYQADRDGAHLILLIAYKIINIFAIDDLQHNIVTPKIAYQLPEPYRRYLLITDNF